MGGSGWERETEDPRAALAARDVKTRAAGARDLAAVGTWDDVEALVGIAMADKSPSLRLCAAAAAADILARHRGAPGHEPPLGRDRADAVLRWVGGSDPGNNPSGLMILSAVVTDRVLDRFGRLLRDPRTDVRKGAGAALERMALSGTMVEDERLAGRIAKWLGGRRLAPDAVLELIHLIGRAGWTSLGSLLSEVSGAGRPHAAAVEEARSRLATRGRPDAWHGLWVGSGFDVLELEVGERDSGWILVGPGGIRTAWGERAALTIDKGMCSGPSKGRMVWARQMGQESYSRAIQMGGRTFWEVPLEEVAGVVEPLLMGLEHEDAPLIAPILEALASETTLRSRRAHALLAWRVGMLGPSLEGLSGLLDAKRPKADLYYWRGRVHLDRGDLDSARQDLSRYLEAAPARSALQTEVRALLEDLR